MTPYQATPMASASAQAPSTPGSRSRRSSRSSARKTRIGRTTTRITAVAFASSARPPRRPHSGKSERRRVAYTRSKANSDAVQNSASSISASPRRPEAVSWYMATSAAPAARPRPMPPSDAPHAMTMPSNASVATAEGRRTAIGPVSWSNVAVTAPAQ